MADDPAPSSSATGAAPSPPMPVDLRDYVRFQPGEATRVRVFATSRLTLDLWCIEPQQATDVLLYRELDVTYTVVGGRSWFVTDQGEIGLDAMGCLLVPAGTAHGIDNRAPDPLIVVATASAPEEDPAALEVDQPVTADRAAIRPDPRDRSGVADRLRALLRGQQDGT